MTRKRKKSKRPLTHEELEGFDIQINEFGQITSTFGIDKINIFLNDHVEDKKLVRRDEAEEEE
jgi:hypothetical protein